MSFFYTSVSNIGDNFLVRGYKGGKRFSKTDTFSPQMFVPSRSNNSVWRSIQGRSLDPVSFDTVRECRDWIKQYSDVTGFEYYGNTNYVSQYIYDHWPNQIEADTSLINKVYIDIEVVSENGFPKPEEALYPILTICLRSNKVDEYIVWGMVNYDEFLTEHDHLKGKIKYVKCSTEQDLLHRFLTWWEKEENTPDVVTGWYIKMFDIPYLVNRIRNLYSDQSVKRLSPWHRVSERNIKILNRDHQTYELEGIQVLDYKELFEKFGYVYGTQESYKLDHIAYVVLGENKLSYDEHGNLHTLYRENPQKYVDYNIKDVELVYKLDQKLDYISLVASIAYRGGTNYSNAFGTVGIWESILYRVLSEKSIAVNPKKYKERGEYPGGFVKEPYVGKHDWVCSFDLNSLYPNLIVQYNMSPETITGEVETHVNIDTILEGTALPNVSKDAVAANGVHFTRNKQGIIPAVIKQLYDERVVIKKRMIEAKQQYEKTQSEDLKNLASKLENDQMVIKILMNSLYGALGNAHFSYFDIRMASAITTTGQLTIRWAEKTINSFLNKILKTSDKDYVIAIDTDSLYINLNDLVKLKYPANADVSEVIGFLDKVCAQKIEPELASAYNRLAATLNAFEDRMVMKREAIASRGIWTAKKRYILNVYNNEGVQYAEPKLKVMGIEAVKSSTPEVCRNKLKEVFKVIMEKTESEVQKFIADFRMEFAKLPPEEVSFPRSVSDMEKNASSSSIYSKGTPIHVRGSLVYNDMLKNKNLSNKYDLIQSGEKIKFCYLKTPNPVREDVIAFPVTLPKELDLHKFIDYNKQYDKSFVEPLKTILTAVGWEVEKTSSLEDFFS